MPKTNVLLVVSIFFAFACGFTHAAGAPQSSTTTLDVSPGKAKIGQAVTLTAKVLLGTTPVQHGSILFCDAKATSCQGLAVLASAQLTSAGSTSVKLTLGAGTYSVKAVFIGTPRSVPPVPGSSSTPQTFTVGRDTKSHSKKANTRP